MSNKVLYQGSYEVREPEAPTFSEGLEPGADFLKRWAETEAKRRIARRLSKMRIEAGFTQVQLAEKMGIDPSYVSRLEASTGPIPKAEIIAQFAAQCGYDTAYAFINRKDGGLELILHSILGSNDEIVEMEGVPAAAVTG